MHRLQADKPPGITNITALRLLQRLSDNVASDPDLLFELSTLEDRKQQLYMQISNDPALAVDLLQLIAQQQSLLARMNRKECDGQA